MDRGRKVVILNIILTITVSVFCDEAVINTKLGTVNGTTSYVYINNRTYTYSVFKNIPYAKPPTGSLRFMKPVPYGKWNGTLDATKFGPSCIQTRTPAYDNILPNKNQSEDCLSLNIYVPANTSVSNKKSVMIWIHGGGYSTGQAMLYEGSYLSAFGDVIVVTLNYRLEAFGFFSTGDAVAPGNYGLWDQKLAIQWVNDNIDRFGGNKNSITIFGESAGGFSVALQAIHANNSGLFQRIIAQSGVSNSLLATSPVSRLAAQEVAQLLNCSNELNASTLNCLRRKSADEIHYAYEVLFNQSRKTPDVHIYIGFAPVVDGDFLIDDPQSIIGKNGSEFNFYKSLDVMIGNCESEGSLLVSELMSRNYNVSNGISSRYLCEHIIPTLSMDYFKNNTRITQAVCAVYNKSTSINEQSMDAVNYYGDVFMYSPAVQSLNSHALNSNNAHYQYLSKKLSILSDTHNSAPWFQGSGHGSELAFLFPFIPLSNATADDKSHSLRLMKYWSNFANTGNVNGEGLQNWPLYDITNRSYALLDVNVTIMNSLYKERMGFWLNEFPRLLVPPNTSTTSPISTEQYTRIYTSSNNNITGNSSPLTTLKPTTLKPKGNGSQTLTSQHWNISFAIFALLLILL